MKQFPTDIDYDQAPKVVIEWFGTEMYAGEFSHGTKHGKGLFARANGDLMVGKFHRGSAHGGKTRLPAGLLRPISMSSPDAFSHILKTLITPHHLLSTVPDRG